MINSNYTLYTTTLSVVTEQEHYTTTKYCSPILTYPNYYKPKNLLLYFNIREFVEMVTCHTFPCFL
jgi:hypothetical protein